MEPTALSVGVYLGVLSGIIGLYRLDGHIDNVASGAGRAGEEFVQGRREQQAIQAGWQFGDDR